MTQGENVNLYPRKQKRGKEGKFPIKEWEKAKRKERKFSIKEWEKVKKEEEEEILSVVQKQRPPSVEHLLPGGIGTYSISHISYVNNNNNNNQRVPKPETSSLYGRQATSTDRNEENSNCSSYTSSGFTLWEESSGKRGKTGKENNAGEKPSLGGKP